MSYPSETAKYRHLTAKYCYVWPNGKFEEWQMPETSGCGIDIASQGDPVVPWAWQFDLPPAEFAAYCGGYVPPNPIQLRGYADSIPVSSDSLDFVYSSHLLEDYLDWMRPLREWVRILKPGGHLIVLVPDRDKWAAALAKGQTPNCAHKHECQGPTEINSYAEPLGLEIVESRFTNIDPDDYSVLFVARKKPCTV